MTTWITLKLLDILLARRGERKTIEVQLQTCYNNTKKQSLENRFQNDKDAAAISFTKYHSNVENQVGVNKYLRLIKKHEVHM